MASPAKTSSIPCKTNPNVNGTEIYNPMRRSFSGSPFTKPAFVTNTRPFNPNSPVKSPSDLPRRHSSGRQTVDSLRDFDKENGTDQNPKPTRLRSPAASKGTKNFMAPTISTASKINASPRKKVLVERNEPARSSVPLPVVKSLIMEDNEPTPMIPLNRKLSFFDVSESTQRNGLKQNNFEVPHELQYNNHGCKEPLKSSADSSMEAEKVESTQEIALKPKNVSFSDLRSLIMEDHESTPEVGLNQKVSFFDVKSIIMEDNAEVPHEYKEPLKSNAYSVMETMPEENGSVKEIPSFQINPKVSALAPLDADPLMVSYDPKTNYLSPRPQFLHYRPNPRIQLYRERDDKQLEEVFATEGYSDTDVTEETLSEGSQRESEDISSESESNPIAAATVEVSFEAKRTSKPRFSTRSKFIALLMVLAFAYFSVLASNSPAFSSRRLEDLTLLNFHVLPEVSEFAKAKLEVFTENLEHWAASFLSYVSNIVFSSREGDRFILFEYANLSHLLEDDHMIEGHHHNLMFDHSLTATEPEMERDVGSEADGESVDEDKELEHQNNEDFKNSEPVSEEETDAGEDDEQKNEDLKNSELVSEAVEQEIGAEMIELDQLGAGSNVYLEDHQPNIIVPQAAEIQLDELINNIADTMFPVEDFTCSSQGSVDDSAKNEPKDRFLTKNMTGFALLVFCLASALIYTKRVNPSMGNVSVPVEQPLSKGGTRNWQTEMDMASESCPSDMSSCHRNSSSYNQSQEKKTRKTYRRESLASSDYSMCSSSYGSFTTYDKIPSKHGGRDEGGIVTPVRRSSRIRNQAISP